MALIDSTLLAIDGIDLSQYATRGLTQTLTTIEQSKQLRRTVNGTMRSIAPPQFQKYSTQISCRDQEGPGFINVWPGKTITVTCIPDLGGDGDETTPLTLVMLVTDWNVSKEEAGVAVSWTLSATEV